ncbi:hypothetical protein OS493_009997 [Desmophyllum pertusum]|uniref:Uncharacterized protein n=1 Tax=Desmophyllum pertusum TaxID=174260 RepID=A0A9W9YEE0_9CNID|nr:hypothetical protein OS493_009997 [Desmophyllum pertusum]
MCVFWFAEPTLQEVSSTIQPFKLEDELAMIEGGIFGTPPTQQNEKSTVPEQTKAQAQAPNSSSDSTGHYYLQILFNGLDGKQLKQLTFAQFMLANLKILESLMTKNPSEASTGSSRSQVIIMKVHNLRTKLDASDSEVRDEGKEDRSPCSGELSAGQEETR